MFHSFFVFTYLGGLSVVVYGPLQKIKMENPFQMDGPSNPVEVDEVKDGTLVRLTLPGVGPDGIKGLG